MPNENFCDVLFQPAGWSGSAADVSFAVTGAPAPANAPTAFGVRCRFPMGSPVTVFVSDSLVGELPVIAYTQ
ncbi:MAG TPA: hypothetical protein VG815_07360 [Chloroflexota bacterium]|nr:hypothetical protein [Chloroflexota bacterium]